MPMCNDPQVDVYLTKIGDRLIRDEWIDRIHAEGGSTSASEPRRETH